MKKIILTLLCLLLLTGCGTEPPPPTEATSPPTEATEATAAPTEPESLYDPASELEQRTGGAVTVYPLNLSASTDIVPFGDDLLLFAGNELIRLDGSRVSVKARTTLDIQILPTDPAVRVSEKGVTYFDALTNDLVFLDGSLKEVSRMALPEGLTGYPALSRDRKNLYYFTAEGLRALNMESRIDRLVTQMAFPYQNLIGLHCGDTIAACSITDEAGVCATVFLDVKTGALLHRTNAYLRLVTLDERYYAEVTDGQYLEKLTGTGTSEPRALYWPELQTRVFPALECGGILTVSPEGQLDFFNCTDGSRPYSIKLPEALSILEVYADPLRSCIWFLAYSESYGCDTLCCWNYCANSTSDETAYLGSRRTAQNPDTQGLADCAALAAQIGEKHRVQILTWLDAADGAPDGYTLESEYQVEVIMDALHRLDAALSNYPKGFLRKAVSEMGDGVLRIGLLRSIRGDRSAGTPEAPGGVQYWDEAMNAHIRLQINVNMEQNLHHELFHVIESRIFSNSLAFDDWDKLNPEGFEYSYNYLDYESRQQDVFYDGELRAFIDAYATTFPKEDRAKVMEYAMMPDSAAYFDSPIMQSKLRAVCLGIREAYALKKTDDTLLWEQYLSEPLKFKK